MKGNRVDSCVRSVVRFVKAAFTVYFFALVFLTLRRYLRYRHMMPALLRYFPET